VEGLKKADSAGDSAARKNIERFRQKRFCWYDLKIWKRIRAEPMVPEADEVAVMPSRLEERCHEEIVALKRIG